MVFISMTLKMQEQAFIDRLSIDWSFCRPIAFIEAIIREGFVDQDANSLIQWYIGEESCDVIFIKWTVSNFISKIKGIGNCELVYGTWFQLLFKPLGEQLQAQSHNDKRYKDS